MRALVLYEQTELDRIHQASISCNNDGGLEWEHLQVIKGLIKFSGTDPLLFEELVHKNILIISLTRPEILELTKRQTRPTTGSTTEGAGGTVAQTQVVYDKANQDLYAILSMVTEAPVSVLVRKHKATTGIRGTGQEALQELTQKYLEVTDESIRSIPAELMATSMTDGQDLDKYFLLATLLRGQVERMGEPTSDRRLSRRSV